MIQTWFKYHSSMSLNFLNNFQTALYVTIFLLGLLRNSCATCLWAQRSHPNNRTYQNLYNFKYYMQLHPNTKRNLIWSHNFRKLYIYSEDKPWFLREKAWIQVSLRNVRVVWITVLLRFWKVPVSNLIPQTSCSEWDFLGPPHVP